MNPIIYSGFLSPAPYPLHVPYVNVDSHSDKGPSHDTSNERFRNILGRSLLFFSGFYSTNITPFLAFLHGNFDESCSKKAPFVLMVKITVKDKCVNKGLFKT